jgi:WD40 repeat protein
VNWHEDGRESIVIRVWDRDSRQWRPEHALPFGAGLPAFHPSRSEIALTGPDGVVRIIDYLTGDLLRHSSARFVGSQTAFSPDGKLLAVSNHYQPAEILDAKTYSVVASIPDARQTSAVSWQPLGDAVFFGDLQGNTYAWNVKHRSGGLLPRAQKAIVESVLLSADGKLVATSSSDHITFVRRATGEFLFSVPGRALRFSAEGNRLAIADHGQVSLYEVTGGNALRFAPASVEGVQFSPDGKLLAAGGADCVRLFAADSLREVCQLALDPCGPVAFRPDGRELLTFGVFSHLWSWPLKRDASQPSWTVGPATRVPLPRESGKLHSLSLEPQRKGRTAAWSADGRTLAVVDYRHDRILLRRSADEPLSVFAELKAASSVLLSPDGKWLAASSEVHSHARVWNLADGRVAAQFPFVSKIAFSADGRLFATSSTHQVQLHRAGDWQTLHTVQRDIADGEASPVTFQPGGHLLAYAPGPGTICLLDTQSFRLVGMLQDREPLRLAQLSFSPDGSRLAFAGADSGLGVWDLAELRDELVKLGLPADGFPENAGDQAADIGDFKVEWAPNLPRPEQWARNWLLLAKWEMLQGSPAGALTHLTAALQQLRIGVTPLEKAELLAARGEVNLVNETPLAARDDWEQALSLNADLPETSLSLARLYLLGPAEVRAPRRALMLLATLVDAPDKERQVRQLSGIAKARLQQWDQARSLLHAEATAADPIGRLFLAVTLHHLGEQSAAADQLRAASESGERLRAKMSLVQRREFDAALADVGAALAAQP